MKAWAAQTAPGLEVAVAAAAVGAHEGAVLAVSAIAALGLAPGNQEDAGLSSAQVH